MMSDLLQKLLSERDWLLADGATGTNLFARGLEHGEAPEMWNLEQPEQIIDHIGSFIAAGSDIVLTNSFGGTRNRLKLHGLDTRAGEVNRIAAELAREALVRSGRQEVVIAGSMGPTGDLFEPVGPLSHDDGVAAFTEQAEGLAEGGVDVLWIETLSSVEEIKAAVQGSATTGLPLVVTLSFDTNGRTMMGVSPVDLVRLVKELHPNPIAFGGNCGTGAAELVLAIKHMAEAVGGSEVIVAKSNCGIPEFKDGEIVYSGTPELMADYVGLAYDSGARIIGGCCGTTPDHIRAMRAALENHHKGAPPSLETIVEHLGEVSKLSSEKPLGERPESGRGGRRGRRGRRGGDDATPARF
jgi:5-methyltetrahydrofolate--homocysteine methyltransferase